MGTRPCALLLAAVGCGGQIEAAAGDASTEPAVECAAADVGGLANVTAIAVDERDVVYWAAQGDVVRHDATSTAVLAHEEADRVTALAVGDTRVFYTLASGALKTVPRDGGASVTLATNGVPQNVQLVATRGDGSLIVAGQDLPSMTRVVSVANGVATNVWMAAGTLESAAVDGEFVYAAVGMSGGAEILQIGVMTDATTVIGTGFQWVPALAVDATRLYVFSVNFNDPNNGVWPNGLLTMSKSGGAPELFFEPSAPYAYGSLAVDGSGIYLSTATMMGYTSPPVIGELWRISFDGQGTNLAGNYSGPITHPYFGFGPVCLGPHAVHWIAHGADPIVDVVRELCR